MRETLWDDIAELDPKELEKITPPGWVAGSMHGGYMLVQSSHIVRVISESGLEGPAKLVLSNEDLIFTRMPLVELAEKINSAQSAHPTPSIPLWAKVIEWIVSVANVIASWFSRLITPKANEKACEERFSLQLDKPKNNVLLSTAPTRRE